MVGAICVQHPTNRRRIERCNKSFQTNARFMVKNAGCRLRGIEQNGPSVTVALAWFVAAAPIFRKPAVPDTRLHVPHALCVSR